MVLLDDRGPEHLVTWDAAMEKSRTRRGEGRGTLPGRQSVTSRNMFESSHIITEAHRSFHESVVINLSRWLLCFDCTLHIYV
ncbi:hypothetical protein EVAR_34785_1 [Eumeta japonica]|uniref:Uncharacterized protein n=1 Tax=Eumeta variegata TaxID=151549 RepID=A0A4C1WCT8_EUMVA|nr:hypothetical protein EVAR_34785_1 [Eumeta japonica]